MTLTIKDSVMNKPYTYHVEIREDELIPSHVRFVFYAPDEIGDNISFSGYFNPKELKEIFKKCITTIDELFGEKNDD